MTACQMFVSVDVKAEGDQLLFSFPNKKQHHQAGLFGIELYKDDCEQDCLYWQVSRRIDEDGSLTSAWINTDVIRYGQSNDYMATTVIAKPLVTGRYTVSGEAGLKKRAGSFITKFELRVDEHQQLHVTTIPSQ